jgi:hypothetical protein
MSISWRWIFFLLLIFILVEFVKLPAKKYCLDDQMRCVSVSGFWLRVDGVAKAEEIILVHRSFFRPRYATIKFRFVPNELNIVGQEASFPWGDAVYLPYGRLGKNEVTNGPIAAYVKQNKVLIDCGAHDCLQDVAKIENARSK